MTEKEKMIAGKIYNADDTELKTLRTKAHKLCKKYNDTFEDEFIKRKNILDELLPNKDEGIYIQGPIYLDYGIFTSIGKNFYANFNLTILDCCPVTIGNNVLIGPNVSIVTPIHPLMYQDRNSTAKDDGTKLSNEYAKPIVIKDNCWIAGNVTIIGGVTIGEGCVIGAGSVVTKDIPSNTLSVGNPCQVLREITDNDAIELKKHLF